MAREQGFVCPDCGLHFEVKPRASWFGLRRITCPHCLGNTTLSLDGFSRGLYWLLLSLGLVAALVLIPQGQWFFPIAGVILSVPLLLIDTVIRSAGVGDTADPDGARGARVRKAVGTIAWTSTCVFLVCATVIVAAATAEYHTVVVSPEQPETYFTEEYPSGDFNVTDDGKPICWVGQDWYECTNLHVDQYNGACVGVSLTLFAEATCDSYWEAVLKMQSEATPGMYVESLGGYGTLTRNEHIATRRVPNGDFKAEISYETVCYLGILGDCP